MCFGLSRSIAWRVGLFAVSTLLVPTVPGQAPTSAAEASFQERIQPIVFKNCNGCHTFGGHAGELRMDSYVSLLKGGDRGAVINPGSPETSLLMKAIGYQDTDLKMPPRGKIAETDIASIERWIRELPSISTSAPPPTAVDARERSVRLSDDCAPVDAGRKLLALWRR